MPVVTFQPAARSVSVPPGTALIDAARELDLDISTPCGGEGTCGKCLVQVIAGDVESQCLGILPRSLLTEGYVLACKGRVQQGDLTIGIPQENGRQGGQFTQATEDRHLVRQELFPRDWQYDPLAVKWYIETAAPQLEDGLSDLDRLTRALQQDWGKKEYRYHLASLRTLPDVLRADKGRVTVTLIREAEAYHIVNIESGNTTTRHYGIAVDVGTTSVAVQLVYLAMAEIVATRIDYNDQVTCGLDVISRINYASGAGRLNDLRARVLGTINRLMRDAAESQGVDPSEICNAVISGNTTMLHLLLGITPEYIRLEPYTPAIHEVPYLTAEEVGIAINPQSWVYLSPCVGSYVGGDITAGLLCTDLTTASEEICMFIDIGTNGELVIGNRDFLMACACSAGPAFEGGGISCGMRAALGAIERVQVDPETGTAAYQTIGNVQPLGICGSGMIALLAELFLTGWIDPAGKFVRSRASESILIDGRQAAYVIAPAEHSGTGKPILISELDIENIIRAKAAIYSASALMLDQVGIEFEGVSKLYIAGGFGRFLDLEKATVIGLLPDLPRDKYQYIGNASLMGSYMVLLSQDYRERQLDLARRMTYMELSTNPTYMDQYTGALFLPHTDPSRFPSVRKLLARPCVLPSV